MHIKRNLILAIIVFAFLATLLTERLCFTASLARLNDKTIVSDEFRQQVFTEESIDCIRQIHSPERGTAAGLYLLDKSEVQNCSEYFSAPNLRQREKLWKKRAAWNVYQEACNSIWEDVKYFPIPESVSHNEYKVTYTDSWMSERSFGGKRGHEGTDIMASENQPGLYPVVSMTDGVVKSKGWLTKGGYRVGVLAPSGGYFYYAHLDSYARIEEGDQIQAGDILGFMGDSGYGPEGTTGMFATHLHVGIYLYPEGVETSVNPYWILRMIEEKKLSCSF